MVSFLMLKDASVMRVPLVLSQDTCNAIVVVDTATIALL